MKFKTTKVNGIKNFYRESEHEQMPGMVLFHGFPSASHMFRNLMPMLEDRFHLIAPENCCAQIAQQIRSFV